MNQRRIRTNLFFVTVSTGVRLGSMLGMYAMLSRALGPSEFGNFIYWYSIGVIASAVSDYGFGQQVLTRLPLADAEKLPQEASRLAQAKLALVTVIFLGVLAYAAGTTRASTDILWIVPLVLGSASSSLFDFFAGMMRARGMYAGEMRWSLFASIGGNLGAGIAAILGGNLVIIASIFLILRMGALLGQYLTWARPSGIVMQSFKFRRVVDVVSTMRGGTAFALDNLSTQLFASVDIIVARYLLSAHDAGLYLAGNRLFQAAMVGVPIIAAVFTPRMVNDQVNVKESTKTYRNLLALTGIAGVVLLLIFIQGREVIVSILYGSQFSALPDLLPLFGIAVLVQFSAAAPGVRLSVMLQQRKRVLANFSAILVMVMALRVMGLCELARNSALSVCLILILGSTAQAVAFGVLAKR